MSLINCLNCGRKISEHAEVCPNCGYAYLRGNVPSGFEWAKYEYNLAVQIVKRIGEVSKTFNPLFSTELALREMDYGIQEVLYIIATRDGIFDSVEKDFIKNLVEYGDIFNDKIVEITLLAGINVDWDVAEKLPQGAEKNILDIMNKYISKSVYVFTECATIAQQFENKNQNQLPSKTMLFELEEKVIHIGTAMANACGVQEDGIIGYICGAVEVVFGQLRRISESKHL